MSSFYQRINCLFINTIFSHIISNIIIFADDYYKAYSEMLIIKNNTTHNLII